MSETEPNISREEWQEVEPFIVYIASAAVGFSVAVYWVDSDFSGIGDGDSYQIMPVTEDDSDFWLWHVGNNPQFFSSPIEAAAVFVSEFRRWQKGVATI